MNYYNCVLQFFLGLVYLSSVVGKICMKVMLLCTVLQNLKKVQFGEVALFDGKDIVISLLLYFQITVLSFEFELLQFTSKMRYEMRQQCGNTCHILGWNIKQCVTNALVVQGCGGLILTAVADIYSRSCHTPSDLAVYWTR